MEEERGAIPCKIVVVGEIGVGKTSLVSGYLNNYFHNSPMSTPGEDFTIKTVYMEKEKNQLNLKYGIQLDKKNI